MTSAYAVEQSKATLKKCFLPYVLLKVRRALLHRRAHIKLSCVSKPTVEVLQLSPLLSSWPSSPLQKLLDASRITFGCAGQTVVFAREPNAHLSLAWVISGKLTQVPTKRELSRCAVNVPATDAEKLPLSGPRVFPTLFYRPGSAPAEPHGARVADKDLLLTAQQEAVLDGLSRYCAAQFLDGDSLLLGDKHHRTIRCLTDVVLLQVPLSLVLEEMKELKATARQATIAAARESVLERLSSSNARPSTFALTSANDVLQGLSTRAIQEIRSQLHPFVFCPGEVICADTFTSDSVFFLGRGKVLLSSHVCGQVRKESRCGVGIGLNSFMAVELPMAFDERRQAKAVVFSELWGISLRSMQGACELSDEVSCSRKAAALVSGYSLKRFSVGNSLAQVPAFLSLSEESLSNIASSMKLRVHHSGKYITPMSAKAPIKEGIIILCGKSSLVSITRKRVLPSSESYASKEAAVPLKPGVATYFCEALLGTAVPVAVRAETSVVALHASAGRILDALGDLTLPEIEAVVDSAKEYVIGMYGAKCGCIDPTPQEQAMARVKAHCRAGDMSSASAKSDSSLATSAMNDAIASGELAAANSILTSISLQIQSLHHHDESAVQYQFLHGVADRAAELDRGSSDAVSATTQAVRKSGCFTIDERGAPVYMAEGCQAEQRRHIRPDFAQSASAYDDASHGDGASSDGGERYDSKLTVRAVPTVPPFIAAQEPSAAGLQSRKHHTVTARSLQVPIDFTHRRRSHSKESQNKLGRPPRLTALRSTVADMKNTADGIDRLAELRRAMNQRQGPR